MTPKKSVLGEVREVQLAVELIGLGARLQFLEAAVTLSRERLIRLYKELKGVSPPKGLLPFSTDWYMTWLANIHSSMFYNIYRFMLDEADENELPALIKAYRLYVEQVFAGRGGRARLHARRDHGALLRQRHAAAEPLQPVRRPLRGACARQQERICVCPVPTAFARGQGTQAQGRRSAPGGLTAAGPRWISAARSRKAVPRVRHRTFGVC
jgi:hypothetical protein